MYRLVCALTALFALVAAPASADSMLPTIYGKGIDWDDPLDGVADETTVSTGTNDLALSMDASGDVSEIREDRGVYEFDLSVVAPFGVSSATLELPIFEADSAVGTINIYAYVANAVLDLADFSETGNLVGPAAVVVPWTSIDVTAAVQAIQAGGDDIVGFMIATTADNQQTSIWQPGFGPGDPHLVFTPVPEPTLAVLLLAGLAALAGARRRSAA